MRGLRRALPLAALAVLGCGSEEPLASEHPACKPLSLSDRGDVRVFVIGHRQELDDAVSYDSYEQSFRRHVEAIEPCLSDRRPNLLVFPENAALGALLIGSRGAPARSQTDSNSAFAAILGEYAEPFGWYDEQFPNAGLRRKVLLALTDTTWRAFDRTFAGIARDFGVWVMSSADVAPAERRSDPALIAALGDPDLAGQEDVWVATSADAFNSAYLFDPSGEIAGRVDKVFLTDPEEADLELDNGAITAVSALVTPFARIGVATSRDAFYPPFMQRLEDLDVDLVVQPEAFSGWGLGALPLEWLPDVFTSSAWTHQQKYRTFAHNLTPQYTGNFFELFFDGQVHITERARPDRNLGGYVGQDPIPGWTAIGPWVVDDPGAESGELSIDERRLALREVGLELLPGSGSARENAYVDSLVAADLELPTAERAPAVPVSRDATLAESRAIDGGAAAHQRNADVAADAGAAIVAWQDARGGDWRIHWATSSDGVSFEPRGEVAPGQAAQIRPAVCVAPDGRVAVVWQEGRPERVRVAIAPSIGAQFSPALEVASGAGPQWEPDCGFRPSGELVVVWSDLATGVSRLAFAVRAADTFGPASAVDATTLGEPRLEGTQAQPALASDASVVVWLDYRDRSWDVFAASWQSSGFSVAQRIDGVPPEAHERLCGEPRVEARGQRVIAAWTDLRERGPHPDIAFAVSDDGGLSWSARSAVPGGPLEIPSKSRGGGSMPRYRPAIALGADGSETVVFQDLAPDKSSIFRAQLGAQPLRLDDTADAPVSLTRPRVTPLGPALLVVWEDDRDGAHRIYASRVE